MGNIVSHNQRQPSELEQHWSTGSFPRSPLPRLPPLKVLPERDAHQKLRPTNNGDILHSGGTLSGRHQYYKHQNEIINVSNIKTLKDQKLNFKIFRIPIALWNTMKDQKVLPLERTYLTNAILYINMVSEKM